MKVNSKNKKKLPILLIVVLAVVLVAGGVIAYYFVNAQEESSTILKQDSPDESEAKQQLEDKKNTIEHQDEQASGGATSNESITLNVQQQNDTVVISTKLNGVSSGKCTLSLKGNSKSFSSNADIIYQPEFSTCAGFLVQKSELGNGTWDIKLEIQTPNGTSSKSVSFEVK